MNSSFSALLLTSFLAVALVAAAQQPDDVLANPGRPTVSTPATLTPAGYLQHESGFQYARHSPEFSSQSSLNEVVKFSLSPRIELLAGTEPFAHSGAEQQSANDAGGVSLGAQGILYNGEGPRPTFALSYFHQVYGGDAPDLDIGSANNSALVLASADVKGFHYDTNYVFNEATRKDGIRRLQVGQTLSISHALTKKTGLTGEIWHFTQPFLRGNAIGNLWALNYNLRNNLVFDGGFDRGLTHTSTRWEVFAGFTYLLPHKILPH